MELKILSIDPAKKIKAIQAYRNLTGAGLAEAKTVIESQPPIVVEVDSVFIHSAISSLQDAGCVLGNSDANKLDELSDAACQTDEEETALQQCSLDNFLQNTSYFDLRIEAKQYSLFGSTVTIEAVINRYFVFKSFLEEAKRYAHVQFSMWHCPEENGLAASLNAYKTFATNLITDYLISPAHKQLALFDIYDVSERGCIKNCLDISPCEDIVHEINLLLTMPTELKESIETQRIQKYDQLANTISGIHHLAGAAVKLFGIATSALQSDSDSDVIAWQGWPADFSDELWTKISESFDKSADLFIDLLNKRVPDTLRAIDFDARMERSIGYLENAERFPLKAPVLLLNAFQECPCNPDLLGYMYKNYPHERAAVQEVAAQYGVSL